MARSAEVRKARRLQRLAAAARRAGRKMAFSTRVYNICGICGRSHGFIRLFGMCRICFRELAHEGRLPGVRKASW